MEEMPFLSTFWEWLIQMSDGGRVEAMERMNEEEAREILLKNKKDEYTLNVFILGPDAESVEDLVRVFCENKVSSRHSEDSETKIGRCVSHNENLISSAENEILEAYLSTERSADKPVFQIMFVCPHKYPGNGQPIIHIAECALHEYIHVYQNAFYLRIYGGDDDPGIATDPMRPGPVWIIEGSADYLSRYIAAKKGWGISQSGIKDFTNEMDKRMTIIGSFRASNPDFFLVQSEDMTIPQVTERFGGKEMNTLLYKAGSWAAAWIVHQAGWDALWINYFQDLPKLGWRSSFEKNFGISVDEFYTKFEEFMSKSREEKLAILPSQ